MIIDTDKITPAQSLAINKIMALTDEQAKKMDIYSKGELEAFFLAGNRDWIITRNPNFRNANNPNLEQYPITVKTADGAFSGNFIIPLLHIAAIQSNLLQK